MNTDEWAYREALRTVARNPDGSIDESALVAAYADLMEFDPAAARLKLAKRRVDDRKRPGTTVPDGQLTFEGMEPYGYEPDRLVADDGKHIIENDLARPEFKSAEARRAAANAERVARHARRKQQEASLYADWALAQLRAGRPGAEITFGNFVRGSGHWAAGDGPPDSDGGQ